MGSDYLFISRDTNRPISPMAHPFGQIPNPEGHAKRNMHKQRAAESPGFGLGFFCFPSIFFACSYNPTRRIAAVYHWPLANGRLLGLLSFWYPIGKKSIDNIRDVLVSLKVCIQLHPVERLWLLWLTNWKGQCCPSICMVWVLNLFHPMSSTGLCFPPENALSGVLIPKSRTNPNGSTMLYSFSLQIKWGLFLNEYHLLVKQSM